MHLILWVSLAAVTSKVMVLLLLIYCFMHPRSFVGVLCLVFVLLFILSVLSSFAIFMPKKAELVALL